MLFFYSRSAVTVTENEGDSQRKWSEVKFNKLRVISCTAPDSFSVQSSYKLNLPPHLIIQSTNIRVIETIGQGILIHLNCVIVTELNGL